MNAAQKPSAVTQTLAGLAARPVAAVLGGVAWLRHGPAIHAVGTCYAARLETRGAGADQVTGVPLLDEPDSRPAIVRLSRGAGLPLALPDVLGLAIRLQGEQRPQDLLLDSSWGSPLGRHLIRLGRSASRGHYGSLLAYSAGGRPVHLSAVGTAPQRTMPHDGAVGSTFRLLIARPYDRRWRHWADLLLLEPVERPALRFSPANDGLGISLRFDGTRFRAPSYRASQRQGPFT